MLQLQIPFLSHSFTQAMKSQPKLEDLDCLFSYYVGLVLLGTGTLFVLSSFLALGFIGTFLGKAAIVIGYSATFSCGVCPRQARNFKVTTDS